MVDYMKVYFNVGWYYAVRKGISVMSACFPLFQTLYHLPYISIISIGLDPPPPISAYVILEQATQGNFF